MGLVLGIDPGSVITGYGIVGEIQGTLKCVTYGIFEGSPKSSLSQRLLKIGEGLKGILEEYEVDAVAVEKTFFAKNVDSVTKLGHARGVVLYEAARAKVPIFEYLPTEIKASLVGNGKAPKDQVQFVVRSLLGLQAMDKFDMSDALAVAIHHARIATTKEKMKRMEITQ